MRILYSCCASGGQHKIQSAVVADMLRSVGHEVNLIDNLPTFITPCKDNVLLLDDCLFEEFPQTSREFLSDMIVNFDPELILNDLEPLLPMMLQALGRKTPIISIDSMHSIDFIDMDKIEFDPHMDKSWGVYTKLVESITPSAALRVIPTFFQPDWKLNLKPSPVEFFGPIIRPSLLELTTTFLDNTVLVYNTNNSFSSLPEILHKNYSKFNFQFFGFGRPHKPNFDATLAHCKFVITNGGHGVISEALCMGKPVFCLPIENHFEQHINAWKVSDLSLGVMSNKEDLITDLDNFITSWPAYKAYVKQYNLRPGNKDILDFLLNHPLLGGAGSKKKQSKQTP